MSLARIAWLSIALCSALAGSSASKSQAQAATPVQAVPANAPPAPTAPAPPPPSSPLLAPAQGAPPVGYPAAPPVYYAPGYAPAYGNQQPPPGYYGIETTPPDYPQPVYQAVQGRRPGPGSHEHEGFYLHLGAGVGAGGASYKERIDGNLSSVRTRGIAVTFDVGIGGRVVENFILHGNVTFTFFDARKKVDGVEDNGYDAIESTLWMIGAGGTYYVMPYNLYLTLVVGTGGFTESRDYQTFDEHTVQIDSMAGIASSFAVGKEWWVGGHGEWGIGAAIKGMFVTTPIEIGSYDSHVTAHSVTLEFSATLN